MKTWIKEHWDVLVVAAAVVAIAVALILLVPRREEPVARGSESYGWLREETVTLTGTGTEGAVSASDTTDGPIRGHVYALHVDYSSSITTTTDLTVTLSSPSLTVLQLTNNYTDTWYYPVVQQTDSAGSGTPTYDRVPVSGYVTVAAGQTISGTIGTVTIWWGE